MKKRIFVFLVSIPMFLACEWGTDDNFDRTVVQRGRFVATLAETGELQALHSKVIIAPNYNWNYGRPKIVALAKEGTAVLAGDFVGQIDTTGVVRYRTQMESDQAIENANLKMLIVEQETALRKLEAELKVQEAALRQAAIDTQRTRFEAPTEQEISRLKFRIAEIAYDKVAKNIEHTKRIQTENLLIQRNKVKRIQGEIDKANKTIASYHLTAPTNGMVVYKKRGWGYNRRKIKIGDEIRRGSPLIALPDLTQMTALATVHETDIGKIHIGQKVHVRLDAFPKELFAGEIINISKICRKKDEKSIIKVFDFQVLLDKAKSICRPGMTVNCEVVVAEFDEALFVGNEFIVDGENSYFVIVRRGGKNVHVPVKLGVRNEDFVVVKGDLKAGEKLVKPEKEDQV